MVNKTTSVFRYSDEDLLGFKQLIDKKLAKAERQLKSTETTLEETTESKDREGDWMDDSSSSNDIQMLEAMIGRQRKHILDLTNALQRLNNKSYGICVVSGQLIDKRRLFAVPTTTKSIAVKLAGTPKAVVRENKPAPASKSTERKVLSKVIKRTGGKPQAIVSPVLDDNEDDLEELYEDYTGDDMVLDLDSISEEDLKSDD